VQFLAILRDSFREAVDGFLIYVMLGLSALAIVLIASLSFEPAPPSEAFTTIAQKFGTAYPNRGGGKEQIGIVVRRGPFNQALPLPIEFAATDVQRMDAGTGSSGSYKFRLTAKPKDVAGPAGKQAMGGMDWFRFLVAAWAKPDLKELTVELDPKTGMPKLPNFGKSEKKENQEPAEAAGPGLDVTIPSITPEDMQGVTDEMMDDFIKNQFAIYAAMDQVSVRRVTTGVKEPGYAFEVETKSSGSVRGWPYVTRGLFGAFTLSRSATLGDMLFTIQDSIVNGIGAGVTLLIAVILTAFFIPNMIRKGSLDLLIAKPISRLKLLIFKYIGGLLFILILSGFTVGGVWVVLGIRSGVWNPEFLLVIPILTFTFAILYSLSTMLGVLTRSAIVAILLTCLFAAFLYVVGFAKSTLDLVRADPKLKEEVPTWVVWTVDGLNNCLPRYKDLDKLTTKLLASSTLTPGEIRSTAMNRLEYPSWGSAIGVSLGFIVLMLVLASLRFVTRDG
jgi:ABC-type transport system involved in multi-copper enzyme maturation permease subunit